MASLPDHPNVATVQRYYDGCNTADVALMRSTFTDDVVHYFVDHAPVRGADGLARYWAKVGPRTKAYWSIDHALAQDDEVVIEWSMRWTPIGHAREELLRGAEWYTFRDGKIAEIRAYHANHHLAAPENAELHGFPYADRGYTGI